VIAGVWWGLLALVLLLALGGKLTETFGTKDGGGQSGHLASSERPSHPGPAEVRDQLIAVTEIAVDKAKKRNPPAAEQLASVLRQMRELSPSDAQLVHLAGLIPDTESIPLLVNAAGYRRSLRRICPRGARLPDRVCGKVAQLATHYGVSRSTVTRGCGCWRPRAWCASCRAGGRSGQTS